MSWETQTLAEECQKAIALAYVGQIEEYMKILPDSNDIRENRDTARARLGYMPLVNLVVPIIVGVVSVLVVFFTQNLSAVLINAIDAVPALLQKRWDSDFEDADSQLDIAIDFGILQSKIAGLAQKKGLQKDSLKSTYEELSRLQKILGYGKIKFDNPKKLIDSIESCKPPM